MVVNKCSPLMTQAFSMPHFYLQYPDYENNQLVYFKSIIPNTTVYIIR